MRAYPSEIGADTSWRFEATDRMNRMYRRQRHIYDGTRRYYLLAVLNEPDACYGILCECAWDSRAIWRQEFLDVLKTFRVRKTE